MINQRPDISPKSDAHLKDAISNISYCCESAHVNLGEVADAIEPGAFGILLLLPALMVILPVSIIPGVSSLCALIVLFVAGHIFFEREELWLPERARNIHFNGKKMSRALQKMGTVATKIDDVSKPRFAFMIEGIMGKITAVMIILLAAVTIILGFIPLVDIFLMLPIVFFGLANYARDGLIAAIGWLVLAIGAGAAAFILI